MNQKQIEAFLSTRSWVGWAAWNRSGAGKHQDKRKKFGKQARQQSRKDEKQASLASQNYL